ncbi:unnamed protein product [Rotaria magnacalcarata]|nr:unnamed protein product [Rotaria magnacalcarata]CAF1225013.1 unnamed protein product [Rotaria magnacalcarata]CAF1910636.1 unnamed protein product [Rotaria magnacalcarata]CAF3865356.1 unnamed protein product [Rotaria magnacalcarata]
MIDWTWLWLVGEIGISYGFYRWWRSNDQFLAALELAPDIDIDDLKQFSSSRTFIDYAAIHGIVRTNDSKPSSVLTSQYLPHCLGVIRRIVLREKKLEKLRDSWTETNKTISDVSHYVPFRLISPSENYIRIDQPLKFSSVVNQLQVTHVKFEPNTTSAMQKLVDTFVGDLSRGIETREEMLLVDSSLTGVGCLEKQSNGIWCLVPHKKWGGILTQSSRAEIISEYRDRSYYVRIFSICFGIVAIGTATYLIHKYYFKNRRQINRLPNILPANNNNETDDQTTARLQCVICLENEIMYSLQPCSHLGLCHLCAQTLQSRNRGEELCPLCRTPIQEYQRIFLP